LLVVITSDRGLCGGFNGTLLRQTDTWIKSQTALGRKVRIRTFGKKARDFFKVRSIAVDEARIEVISARYQSEVAALAEYMVTGFTSGEYDECVVAYNQFKNTLTQIPTYARVLPLSIDTSSLAATGSGAVDYVYEPKGGAILETLLPLYLRTLLLQCFLETEAGEQAARMTAMDNATRNATDLIKSLTLDYNRGRQAAITKELIEIVSGAEAL